MKKYVFNEDVRIKESVDVYSEVFNMKDHDFDKAKHIFNKYGLDFSSIIKAEKKGIMSIFKQKPTTETYAFALLIAMMHNGDL